jgi:hypothetical protein
MNHITMKELMNRTLHLSGLEGLSFGKGNRKFDDTFTFSLPAGHACPFAKNCRSCVINNPRKRHDIGDTRKFIIQDGPKSTFRCSAAIDEAIRPSVRLARWRNFLILLSATAKGKWATVKLIEKTLPNNPKNLPTRVHVSGDYFNQTYFDAWMEVARRHPGRIFYSYTKALPFWIKRLDTIPKNVILTASYGGTHDWMIEQYGLKFAVVVSSVEEANRLLLKIDHDDSLALTRDVSFALLIHGSQPKGKMAKAWMALKKMGMGGYGKNKSRTILAGH